MFLFTTNGLYKELGKTIDSRNYQESPALCFVSFLEKHKNFMMRKNINPWDLVFYSRVYLVTNPYYFLKLISETNKHIRLYNLPYSLNDSHEIHGRQHPLMESFFHWGGHFNITPNFIQNLVDCGFIFDAKFYNKVLSLTQGLEVSESFQVTNHPRKWDFLKCYEVFKLYLGKTPELSEDNLSYLQKLAVS